MRNVPYPMDLSTLELAHDQAVRDGLDVALSLKIPGDNRYYVVVPRDMLGKVFVRIDTVAYVTRYDVPEHNHVTFYIEGVDDPLLDRQRVEPITPEV